MFYQSTAGLCKYFPIMRADVSPTYSIDWHVKCFPERVGVCCISLGIAFNMAEGTRCIIVEEKDASVLVRHPDVSCSG